MEAVIRICLSALLLMISAVAAADIALISGGTSRVAEKLQSLASASLRQEVVLTDAATVSATPGRWKAVIGMGPESLEGLSLPGNVPVIGVFLSRSDYFANPKPWTTAIFVEPPFARQARLARELFRDHQEFGALVADQVSADINGVLSIPDVHVYRLDQYGSLNQALLKLLGENQALIGVYDPDLYSPDNIKNILITAYRHNRPLIGPSAAYLRAGALATTYSSLEDVVERLTEVISQGLAGKGWAPPGYNPHFRVGFNEQVGRSLNLILPAPADIEWTLRRQEGLE